MKSFRQGDVLLIEVNAVPQDATKRKRDARGVVLMEGERTGHHHRFDGDSGVALLERPSGERFATLSKPAGLQHEEHGTIMFTGKKFQQVFQVEDFGEEIRPVQD